jgi:hypothetical protein
MTPTLAQCIARLKVRLNLVVTGQSQGRILITLRGSIPQCCEQVTALVKKLSLFYGLNRMSRDAMQLGWGGLLPVIHKIQTVPCGQPSGIFAAVGDQPIPVGGRRV